MQAAPLLKDLVLVGGGHSHVHVVRSFGMIIARDGPQPFGQLLCLSAYVLVYVWLENDAGEEFLVSRETRTGIIPQLLR